MAISKAAINKNFCILPWVHVRLNQDAKVLPCCRIEDFYSYGDLKEQSFLEIWNSQPIKKIRQAMLAGEDVSMCKGCRQIEDGGGKSLRSQMNKVFQDDVIKIKEAHEKSMDYQAQIKFLDIRFSNNCNFSCRSCNSDNSTSWYKDALHFSNKPAKKLIQFDEVEAVVHRIIDEDKGNLKRIYFAGGEPLIQKQHYKVLEKLIKLKRFDIEIMYNTNLSTLRFHEWKILDMWKKFDRVSVSASLDGVLNKAEFIRHGTVWEDIENNYLNIMSSAPNVELSIAPTISVYNAFHITEAISYFYEKRMIQNASQISLNILTQPHYLSSSLFNVKEKEELFERYDQFLSNFKKIASEEIYQKIKSELNRLKLFLSETQTIDRKSFKNFSVKVDKIRNQKTLKNFPELLSLIIDV